MMRYMDAQCQLTAIQHKPRWSVDIGSVLIDCQPCIGDDSTLFVASQKGYLKRINKYQLVAALGKVQASWWAGSNSSLCPLAIWWQLTPQS